MSEFLKRKNIRLKDFDYSQNGYYYVTICTKDRKNLFWESVGADIIRPYEIIVDGHRANEALGFKGNWVSCMAKIILRTRNPQ